MCSCAVRFAAVLPSNRDMPIVGSSTALLYPAFKNNNNRAVAWIGYVQPECTHSRPQSPSFLGHVVRKRGALEAAVTGCQKISDIRSRMCRSYNITAHAHNVFLSLTAPLGKKFYFLSSLQRVACLGCFENAPLHSTWIH